MNDFNKLVDYLEEKIEKWLIHFISKKDQFDIVHQVDYDLKGTQDELLQVWVKQEVTIAPLQNSIG